MENKRAAMELSMSTIVILVLAMTMLILGLVLVRTIFQTGQGSIEKIDEKVKGEINKLFSEGESVVIHLTNNKAEIPPGESFGVAFGIKNTGQTGEFVWNVEVSDTKVNEKCGVTEQQAENWITAGGSDSADLTSGKDYKDIIFFNIPEGQVNDLSRCLVRFKLVVTLNGNPYETKPFHVQTV